MPIASIDCIKALAPDQHGIRLKVKVVDWLVTVATKKNDVTIEISEYLVGDQSGCIMLKTPIKDHFKGDQWIEIRNGYTQVVQRSLRLVVDDISDVVILDSNNDDSTEVDTSNNISFIEFLAKH